jgi:hypothetical protein
MANKHGSTHLQSQLLKRQREEDLEFEVNPGKGHCLENKIKNSKGLGA